MAQPVHMASHVRYAYDYHRTVYEEHSVLNWFRGILQTDGGFDASKIALTEGQRMDDLELALLPVLRSRAPQFTALTSAA
jgi:hypothetical protein